MFFHIGYHRTGTTYFQSFVSQNREKLLDIGCLLPVTGYDGRTHSRLALCLPSQRDAQIQQIKSTPNPGELIPNSSALAAERLYYSLGDELRNSSNHCALVTSECFLEWLDVGTFQEVTAGAGIEPQIIVMLRRQDRWIESVYSQVIKDPELAFAGEFEYLPQHSLLNFGSVLGPWIDCFGRENVHVRFYEEGASPLTTTLQILRILEIDSALLETKEWARHHAYENASVDECCVEVLRILNKEQAVTERVRTAIEASSNKFRESGAFRKWQLSKSKAAELMQAYQSRNEDFFDRLRLRPDHNWGDASESSSEDLRNIKYRELLAALEANLQGHTFEALRRQLGSKH